MTIELLGLPFSPWSEKARWALDARGIAYVSRVYQPMLGEPALRWKTRTFSGPVTVPVLTDDAGEVVADSADIARWADARGSGPTLFPAEHAADVDRWIAISERALPAGRAMSLARLVHDDDACLEMVPRPLRASRSLGVAIGAFGLRRTLRKYDGHRSGSAEHRRVMAEALTELRTAIATAKNGTLFGALTFADICAAQIVAFCEPPKKGLRMGKHTRERFGDAELKQRFPDVVAWRDELYERHR